MEDADPASQPLHNEMTATIRTSSREELIESIKRGESPTWVPNPALEAFFAKQDDILRDAQSASPQPALPIHSDPNGVPPQAPNTISDTQYLLADPPGEIERPRSALHSGDFREDSDKQLTPHKVSSTSGHLNNTLCTTLPPSSPPWDSNSRVSPLARFHLDSVNIGDSSRGNARRARAPSLGSSLSSSFVMRTPTSPLVYSASNAEPDVKPQGGFAHLSSSPDKGNRRRTLPSETFRSLETSPGSYHAPNFSRPLPPPRRETSLPYEGHRPRRSLTSFTYQPASSPQTPTFLRSRRPSMSSDISPSHRASMVGSFEESILRGRMSTPPSKPIDFVAQIGVLGKGDCKPSLRCPAHVTIPFPAVFYSYPSIGGNRSFSDDSPSPYVGNIDLEHTLKPIETRRHRKRHSSPFSSSDTSNLDITAPENTPIGRALAREERQKRRRSFSPILPLGGCYRVPEHGQLQIVIKNPNKTAVKLYLVPYNLEGMEPGTKTFVRQRSFSAGPTIEDALSDKTQSPLLPDPLKDKHVLRYLIHLKFCCPSRGRFYLYDNIRVVFANRVPDGKEKLRNEIQLPEPLYSPYKPIREPSMGSAGAKLAAENALRRRSSGLGMTPTAFDAMDGIPLTGYSDTHAQPIMPSIPAIPFHLGTPLLRALAKSVPSQNVVPLEALSMPAQQYNHPGTNSLGPFPSREQRISPVPGFHPSTSTRGSPIPWEPDSGQSSLRSFSPASLESGEGLLARKLRTFDAQQNKGVSD